MRPGYDADRRILNSTASSSWVRLEGFSCTVTTWHCEPRKLNSAAQLPRLGSKGGLHWLKAQSVQVSRQYEALSLRTVDLDEVLIKPTLRNFLQCLAESTVLCLRSLSRSSVG